LAKELLREVYAAVDVAHARRRMIVFLQHCADADTVELTRLARTIDRWMPEILAYHATSGASNGAGREHPHACREDPQNIRLPALAGPFSKDPRPAGRDG